MNEEIIIITPEGEVIDIELCFKHGHQPQHGHKYRYKVDHEYYITHHHIMTGAQILEKAGKTPAEYMLRQKIHGNWVTIEPNQEVDFTAKGIEKFKTIKNEHTEGESEESLKRDFSLPEEDEEYLNSLKLPWETVQDGQAQWVLIHSYTIPTGYNKERVLLGVRITPNYPDAQLDMLYFSPALSRTDGIAIGAVSPLTITGVGFQQWSRHRTAGNPWRPGVDNLSTHVPLAEMWLKQEFIKKPAHDLRA
ncbi:MAG: multiubiquitin domain-containing protein [Sphingobacteriales bacterium]|nr:multiubiquitin domain-containing protein [Sphingobacteriales bacterium]